MLRDGLRALSESLLSTSSGGSSSEKLTLGDVGEPPPGSPPQRRRCRDVACLAFFALYWVGMLLVSAQAYYEGDLRRLYSGYDSDDNLCGIDDSVRHAPFVYFPCLQYGGRHPTVCMPRCPAISAHYVRWYNGSQIMCPTASRSLHKIPATTYPTANLLHNCVPGAPSLYAVVADRIDQSAFTSVLAGLFRAWHVVLLAAAAAAALALLWAACIRAMCRARAMAVSTVLVAVASLALLAAALWVRAFYLSSAAFADEHPIFLGSLEVAINTDMSLVLALVTTVFAVSVAVALWCGLLHRLLEGGGIIAEAAEAVAAMPALLLVIPPVVSVLLVGLFFFWGYVALLIATAGTPIKGELAYDRPLQWLLILHAAGVLWSAEALLHVGCCATSAVVVRWCAPRKFSAAQIRPRNSAAQFGRATLSTAAPRLAPLQVLRVDRLRRAARQPPHRRRARPRRRQVPAVQQRLGGARRGFDDPGADLPVLLGTLPPPDADQREGEARAPRDRAVLPALLPRRLHAVGPVRVAQRVRPALRARPAVLRGSAPGV